MLPFLVVRHVVIVCLLVVCLGPYEFLLIWLVLVQFELGLADDSYLFTKEIFKSVASASLRPYLCLLS